MTFNLRFDNPADGPNAWPFRVQQAIETIAGAEPLVVGTQEGLHHMLIDLQRGLPDFAYVGEGRDGGTNGEYSAIFYRADLLSVVSSGQFWLSETPAVPGSRSWDSDCTRICTWACFRSRTNPAVQFLVFNTHLDHISQAAREHGIVMIWEAIRSRSVSNGVPALLMGDFNACPDNPVLQFLRGEQSLLGRSAALQDAYGSSGGANSAGATFHGFRGGTEGQPIDYIFGSPGLTFHDTRVERDATAGRYPSDHYPVTTTVRLAGEPHS